MSSCSGDDCQHSSHIGQPVKEVAPKKAPVKKYSPPTSVPAVPKVKGIAIKFMFGQALTICECGNGHQLKFCRYVRKGIEIDARGRKVKTADIFINCNECNNMRPIQEHVAEHKEIMAKYTK